MKKLLSKLEGMVELKLIQTENAKNVFAGSIQYDTSDRDDTSDSYDSSNYSDYSISND